MYDWNTDHKNDNSYYNLWDAKNTTGNSYAGAFIKTVYDPSPAGFHVPRRAAFSIIQDGKYAGKPFLPTAGYYKPGVAADPKANENGYDIYKKCRYWLHLDMRKTKMDMAWSDCTSWYGCLHQWQPFRNASRHLSIRFALWCQRNSY